MPPEYHSPAKYGVGVSSAEEKEIVENEITKNDVVLVP